jgi:error-prone DNA polymerase
MDYAELVSASNFSFLDGASHPEELVEQALALGLRALALTDRDGLYGVVRAHARLRELRRSAPTELATQAQVFKLIVGARLKIDQYPPLVLLAENRDGYSNLCALVTRGRLRSPKGTSCLYLTDLQNRTTGLLALLLDARPPLPPGQRPQARLHPELLKQARDLFGSNLYLAVARHLEPGQEERIRQTVRLGQEQGVPLVAVGDVRYHHPSRQPLHDVLTCIREGCTVTTAGQRLRPNGERHLRSPAQMARLFADLPQAVHTSVTLAERCSFSLDMLTYRYPSELLPAGQHDAMRYLADLVRQGCRWRYPAGTPAAVQRQLEHELQLIGKLSFPHYFLTVHDLVRFARHRGILCQGRGSAANSAVCYVLGITAVDPVDSQLLFERFISEERGDPPDIDVDCEHERREEIIQYLYNKYGRHRAAMACTVVTYRPRSALREVGKALEIPPAAVEQLAHNCVHEGITPALFQQVGLDASHQGIRQYGALARQLLHFPRHLSIHVGGFLLSDEPLHHLVPIENAAMEGRTVIQWDKDDLETLRLLKVDVLALGMLSCLRKTFELIDQKEGQQLSLATIPADDHAVYDMICQADTVGVFQIESRAQMNMLPRLKPRNYYDLVVEIAIIRPGPIQGKMVHPYLRRRNGEEPVQFPHPALEEILGRTYGVPLFQEQVMRLAMAVADFTPGEADQLRRAMGSWRRTGQMNALSQRLLQGMQNNGLAPSFAQQILNQIKGFAEYGFPESHAASFALLVYASAYLKYYYPACFVCGLLNSLPMGFYPPRTLVADAQRHGVLVRPVDVQESSWDSTLEALPSGPNQRRQALRLGFRLIKGMKRADAEDLLTARQSQGPFRSLTDLQKRTNLNRSALERLAQAGALQSLVASRRRALWMIRGLAPVDDLFHEVEPTDRDISLPQASPLEEVVSDYQALGFSLRAHPLELARPTLQQRGVASAQELLDSPSGQLVTVAGLVVARQRPATASGVVFLSLEDETGLANAVIWPAVFERFRQILLSHSVLLLRGPLQRVDLVAHVVAQQVAPLNLGAKEPLRLTSRDFH